MMVHFWFTDNELLQILIANSSTNRKTSINPSHISPHLDKAILINDSFVFIRTTRSLINSDLPHGSIIFEDKPTRITKVCKWYCPILYKTHKQCGPCIYGILLRNFQKIIVKVSAHFLKLFRDLLFLINMRDVIKFLYASYMFLNFLQ